MEMEEKIIIHDYKELVKKASGYLDGLVVFLDEFPLKAFEFYFCSLHEQVHFIKIKEPKQFFRALRKLNRKVKCYIRNKTIIDILNSEFFLNLKPIDDSYDYDPSHIVIIVTQKKEKVQSSEDLNIYLVGVSSPMNDNFFSKLEIDLVYPMGSFEKKMISEFHRMYTQDDLYLYRFADD